MTPELIAWAQILFVMERAHQRRLATRFGRYLRDKRVICLGIPDDYPSMAPDLVALLRARVPGHLRGALGA